MADIDDDVPPLEDMSDLLSKVDMLRDYKLSEGEKADLTDTQEEGKEHSKENKQINIQKAVPPKVDTCHKVDTFGGMKKGFLFGGSTNKKADSKSKTDKPKDVDMPYIKPTKSKEEELKLPELQHAQETAQAFINNKDTWLNDDLMKNVEKNEKLLKRLSDPTFMAAITEFQSNPQAASLKYQNNKEMQEFFQDFCGMMGDHFTKVGSTQESQTSKTSSKPTIQTQTARPSADIKVQSSSDPKQPTAMDEQRMQEILADPEVRDILQDPRVQKMFEVLRQDPSKAQRYVKEADPVLQQRLRKLVEVGLLQFER